jgi:hypothetical protein
MSSARGFAAAVRDAFAVVAERRCPFAFGSAPAAVVLICRQIDAQAVADRRRRRALRLTHAGLTKRARTGVGPAAALAAVVGIRFRIDAQVSAQDRSAVAS